MLFSLFTLPLSALALLNHNSVCWVVCVGVVDGNDGYFWWFANLGHCDGGWLWNSWWPWYLALVWGKSDYGWDPVEHFHEWISAHGAQLSYLPLAAVVQNAPNTSGGQGAPINIIGGVTWAAAGREIKCCYMVGNPSAHGNALLDPSHGISLGSLGMVIRQMKQLPGWSYVSLDLIIVWIEGPPRNSYMHSLQPHDGRKL